MSYMLDLEVYEGVQPRIQKKAPTNTDPLSLTRGENDLIDRVATEATRLLSINGLSTRPQVNVLYAALLGIQAVLSKNWNGLAGAASIGLTATDEVHGISPYILHEQDGAQRNIVHPDRAALKDLALRLGRAREPSAESERDAASCLRAMVCAAIAADRGLIHIAKENFGYVIRTLSREDCAMRRNITWTDGLLNFARRHARSLVKMP